VVEPRAMDQRWRKALGALVRVVFVAAVIVVLSRAVSWKDLADAIAGMDPRWVALAVAAYGPAILVLCYRLTVLLRGHAAPFSYRTVTVLTFGGNLLNLVLPGGNGGDLYKAVQLARLSDGRATESVTVLLIDRVIGLASFIAIALVMIALSWSEGLGPLGRAVGVILFVGLLAGVAYTSPAVRRALRWEQLLARLPFGAHLGRIDATLIGLRENPSLTLRAFALSMLAQSLGAVSMISLGFASGIDPARRLDFIVPTTLAYTVSTIASAIPITVQGFGVTEAIFYRLLVEPGWCTLPQLLATTLSYRAVALLWALPGAPAGLTRLDPARQ
jgi:uncharacterized membrane protein YbhN (UPF0104 family)